MSMFQAIKLNNNGETRLREILDLYRKQGLTDDAFQVAKEPIENRYLIGQAHVNHSLGNGLRKENKTDLIPYRRPSSSAIGTPPARQHSPGEICTTNQDYEPIRQRLRGYIDLLPRSQTARLDAIIFQILREADLIRARRIVASALYQQFGLIITQHRMKHGLVSIACTPKIGKHQIMPG